MMRVFVYGTLRQQEPNHHYMTGSRFVCQTQTAPEFTLVSLGEYPGLIERGRTAITGEVYDIDVVTLARLDLFEEVPELYRRVSRPLLGHTTMLYVLPQRFCADAPIIATGDWRSRR